MSFIKYGKQYFLFLIHLYFFISLKFCSCVCVFHFWYTCTFFFHWNFPVTAMKTNVFCICYEAVTLVQRDKREYKGSLKNACNGVWASKNMKNCVFYFLQTCPFFFIAILCTVSLFFYFWYTCTFLFHWNFVLCLCFSFLIDLYFFFFIGIFQ